jgi:hypothetical protein
MPGGEKLGFLSFLQDFDDLIHDHWNFVQAREIVLVLPGRVKGDEVDEGREVQMDSVELVDGHQIELQVDGFDPFLQVANHQDAAELFLLGEAGGVDGFETGDPLFEGVLCFGT